ncbi:MAG: hypothetical protein WD875_06560 [Pirellulales bacterium]
MFATLRFATAAIVAAGVLSLAADFGRGQDSPTDRDEATSSGSTGNAVVGGATPEETFKMAAAAVEKSDWKRFSLSMTAESQEMMAGSMAMGGMMMQAFAELGDQDAAAAKKMKQTLQKHGLTDEFFKKLDEGGQPKNEQEAMKLVLKPVKNRPQFIADMMAAMKSMKGFEDESPFNKNSALKDVKIDGDSSKGTIEYERDGEKKTDPVAFKKVGDKWLMDITEAMKGRPDEPPLDLDGDIPGEVP